jgi:O-succinylbenzoate synthase
LRHRIPEIVTIRLDANRGWEFNDAVVVPSNVRDCGIEYIEEPLRDTRRLTELFEKTGLPYALDETLRATDRSVLLASDSAFDEEDPIADAAARARHKILRDACAWIVKPSLLGISPTEIALGLPLTSLSSKVVISSAFESSLGLVALANIAACVNEEDIPAGLDTHRWFQNNLLDAPLRIHNGTLDLEHANSLVSAFSPDGLELVANG